MFDCVSVVFDNHDWCGGSEGFLLHDWHVRLYFGQDRWWVVESLALQSLASEFELGSHLDRALDFLVEDLQSLFSHHGTHVCLRAHWVSDFERFSLGNETI